MSDDLRDGIAKELAASRYTKPPQHLFDQADAILALPELATLRRDAAIGRWVREHTNQWDRLHNPVVAAVMHLYEASAPTVPEDDRQHAVAETEDQHG